MVIKKYISKKQDNSDNNVEQTQQSNTKEQAKNSLSIAGEDILNEKMEKLYLQLEVLKSKLANATSNEERQQINEMVTNASRDLSNVLKVGTKV